MSRGGHRSLASRSRRDGTTAYAVLCWIDGRQSTLTFDDQAKAKALRAAVKAHVVGHRSRVAYAVAAAHARAAFHYRCQFATASAAASCTCPCTCLASAITSGSTLRVMPTSWC